MDTRCHMYKRYRKMMREKNGNCRNGCAIIHKRERERLDVEIHRGFPHDHRTEERRRRVQCLDSPYYIEAGGIIKKSINSRALLQYSVGWMATNTTSHTPFFLFCIPPRNYRNPAASRQLALWRERSGGVIFEERERAELPIFLFIYPSSSFYME